MKRRRPPSQREPSPDPMSMLKQSTSMMVAGFRVGNWSNEKIAEVVKDSIKEALEGEGPFVQVANFGQGAEAILSTAGIFRAVFDHFGIDLSDQREQERWFAFVEKSLEAELLRA